MRRVAIVTGAARGIGAATVRRLVGDDWAVVAVDRCSDDPAIGYALASRADLDEVASAGEVTPLVADVRDVEGLAAAVATAVDRYGGLDAAIAVAGVIAGGGQHWDLAPAAERAIVDVDLIGVMNLARVAVPVLLGRPEPRSGRFVAVASAAATRGLRGLAAYAGAKAGVVGFTRGLAADLAGTGVSAVAVTPGSTDTAMLQASAGLYDLADRAEFADQQPVGRLLDPDEVAATIAWLAGPAPAGITGTVVAVDGGMSL